MPGSILSAFLDPMRSEEREIEKEESYIVTLSSRNGKKKEVGFRRGMRGGTSLGGRAEGSLHETQEISMSFRTAIENRNLRLECGVARALEEPEI